MRKLSPNLDRDDALDTVLEVPIPEEMFGSNSWRLKPWQNVKSWMTARPQGGRVDAVYGSRPAEVQFLLGVIGAPLIPFPVRSGGALMNDDIKSLPIERSMAKYIVQQYIAAAGGEHALNSIDGMYAMGKVKMAASEFVGGGDSNSASAKLARVKSIKNGRGEIGGFVLWQKRPDLWSLELMLSGSKICAGSDGGVAWRQTPWQSSHASRGPTRPLRRSVQGLDPRLTANLFSDSICIGEKAIDGQDCFVLKLEAEAATLEARSSANVEILRHTVWGCFSQRAGLLVHLEDTHLLRIRTPTNVVLWETSMESLIEDYRTIQGVNIAHAGRTCVSLFRFGGEGSEENHARTTMEEIWSIEEVDFNVRGLSRDFFLPPADLKREDDNWENRGLDCKGRPPSYGKIVGVKGTRKVVAIDENVAGLPSQEDEM